MIKDDPYLEILRQRVEEMEKRDKTGLSLVEILKPYSDLYHYCISKEYWVINKKEYGE